MLEVIEDKRTEFKTKLTDKFEKEVISFLNTGGGTIYIGVNDTGEVVGIDGNIDLMEQQIKDKIKNNIMPSTLGLFDVVVKYFDETKKYIEVVIAGGNQRPYYLKGMGMTPDSCFIRVGSSIESMNEEMILNLFSNRARYTLKNIKSPHQDLKFQTLKMFYIESGYKITDNFLKQLDFYTLNNEFNYIAYLFADENNIPILFAKYDGNDVYNLIENENFGYCSLIEATKKILAKIQIENRIYTKIETTRKEIKMFDYDAVKELVTNALVHNDWSNGYVPKFEIFDSKLVISSNGGIQEGVTQKEFLEGYSNPRNPEIMRVFRDLDLVEQLGTGIRRALKTYSRDIFEFFPNHIRVTIPFKENKFMKEKNNFEKLDISQIQKNILKLISDNPSITQDELALKLNVTRRTIIRNFKLLIEGDYIRRVGNNKNGKWQILQ